ncbi:hypothetical protein C8N46_11713 [Kordia periserrulae]|uniref:Uncharacterized protein n=1 Tax=Kordia periserrulae TaxID=701523 RepID=A0A2T6BQJ2_9FLAO|nr:hypothetical protein [Kordia periserrulae]PTX58237.1 hypothetical protein C8N46_11713 [Kordia periserrulae]
MNTGIKRIGKGLFAIFMIKLTLFVGVLIFQSCQKENDFEIERNEELKQNFLEALKESNYRLEEVKSNIKLIRYNEFDLKSNDTINWKQVCLERNLQNDALVNGDSIITATVVNSLGDVFDLANQIGTRPIVVNEPEPSDNTNNTSNFDYYHTCYYFDETPIMNAISPVVTEAKNYLYQYGFDNQEIQDMIVTEGGTEEDLIPLVMTMVNAEQDNSVTMNYLSLFAPSVNAQSWQEVGRCAAYAIGADVLYSLGGGDSSKWTKKSIKKAFKAVAKRLLGPIGVAIAVVSFGLCLLGAA